MKKITWKSAYELGIPEIDEQHKKLVEILGELYDAQQMGTSKAVIHETIEKLIEYTKYHFSSEEALFINTDYQDKEEHIREHKEFIDEVNKFYQDLKSGNLVLTMKTLDFLKDWTINHIFGTDKDYEKYLTAK